MIEQIGQNTNVSKQEWPGIYPQKWHGGKVHLRPQDCLNSKYEQPPLPLKGKKMFETQYSKKYEYKPHTRQFEGKHLNQTQENDYRYQVRHFNYVPTDKKDRAQLRHYGEKQSGHLEDINYGIKTYDYANQTRGNTWALEEQMNQKKRLNSLSGKRNNLNCYSLGDKSYRYPEYSAGFYKEGGLIPGSNMRAKPLKKASEKTLTSTRVPGKLTWKERVKKDERQVEEDAVGELDDWVENVLKDANPNYQDPDLFFEKMEEKEEPKQATKKDAKKGKK